MALSPLGPGRSGASTIVAPGVGATISPGTILRAGAVVTSSSRQFQLTMQADGNLVLLGNSQLVWSTNTANNPGAWAVMQTDGNFVVYTARGVAIWWSGSAGHPDAHAVIITDGSFAVVGASATYFQSHTVDSVLGTGQALYANQVLTSAGHNYALIMQADGNLVMYGQTATWNSHTNRNPGAWAVMQTDGNLVVYSAAGKALWNSATNGRGAATLTVTDANNLVVMGPASQVYWQTAPPVTAVSGAGEAPIDGTTAATNLTANHSMVAGQSISTVGGQYALVMQTDGNLVLYTSASKARWASGTQGHPGAWAVMQGDGNFVVYSGDAKPKPLWNSRTGGTPATTVSLTTDGTMLVSSTAGVAMYVAPGGTQGLKIVAAANSTVGIPYCWDGGSQYGPSKGIDATCTGKTVGYDCSGLAMYAVYQATHVVLEHYSGSQYNNYARNGGVRIAKSALEPGDLVFFTGDDGTPTQPGHVGIYVGSGKMIDAPHSGVTIGVHSLYDGYVGAVRYWH